MMKLLVAIFILLLLSGCKPNALEMGAMHTRIDDLEASLKREVTYLGREVAELHREVDSLQSDVAGLRHEKMKIDTLWREIFRGMDPAVLIDGSCRKIIPVVRDQIPKVGPMPCTEHMCECDENGCREKGLQ